MPDAIDAPVSHCTFQTADELLRVLNPANEFWNPDPTAWIFRGHADSTWRLLASGHRPGAYDNFHPPATILQASDEWDRLKQCELWLVDEFRKALDEVGLTIPSVAPNPKPMSSRWQYDNEIQPDAWPLWALAQHHSIPTSLLDWTRRSRNAAYFAAAGAVSMNTDGCLDVWALRSDFLASQYYEESRLGKLELFQAPRSSNPNLHAQSGLFTVLRGCERPLAVDEFILALVEEQKARTDRALTFQQPLMRQCLLPRSEAPRLLRLLAYEGVTGASMFPGYDGVVKSLREQTQWDCPPARDHWRTWD